MDLPTIRARHAADEAMVHGHGGSVAYIRPGAAHADRGALLDALEQAEQPYHTVVKLLARIADLERDLFNARQAVLTEGLRADAAQAALDRLAAVTVEEVALALDVPDAWDFEAMAAAVLTLVRARVEGSGG